MRYRENKINLWLVCGVSDEGIRATVVHWDKLIIKYIELLLVAASLFRSSFWRQFDADLVEMVRERWLCCMSGERVMRVRDV